MTPPRDRPVRIGTRGSPLALAQAHEVRDRLQAAHPALRAPGATEVVVLSTRGDRVLDRPLAEIGGKGLFTEEIEAALLDGSLDLAVHSLKDMPTALPSGLHLPCILPREDPRDVLLWRPDLALDTQAAERGDWLMALPSGARVGTSSLRRAAQVLAARPDLQITGFRGNVGSRMRKLEAGEADATLLALAGLRRLGIAVGALLSTEALLPAVAQGAICVECRVDDLATAALLQAIACPASRRAVSAERAMLAALEGSCRTPIAGLCEPIVGGLRLRGLVASEDGRRVARAEATLALASPPATGDAGDDTPALRAAEALGASVAALLREASAALLGAG